MLMVLLSVWTCVLILAWLIRSKFRNSEFDWVMAVVFAPAGLVAVGLAGTFNNLITRLTPLHFVDGPPLYRLGAFFLGPGLGEEFFKMGMGLFTVLFLAVLTPRVKDNTRVIGMVIVGLTFAAVENLWVYSTIVDELGMIQRSYLAVPLHACCGMIHGYAINKSYARGKFWPLLTGYAVAAAMHAAYDTVDIQLDLLLRALGLTDAFRNVTIPPEMLYGPIVVALIVWSVVIWRNTRELTPIRSAADLDEEAKQWQINSERWEARHRK